MKIFLAVLFISIGLYLGTVVVESAEDRFPGLPPTAIQLKAQNEGVRLWHYEQDTGCGNNDIYASVRAGMQSWEDTTGIDYIEVANSFRHRSTCGVKFAASCGNNPGVIGCLGEGYASNVNVAYRGDTMATFFFQSQVAIVLHEECHAVAGCNEQYGAGLVCLPIADFMSCGAGAAKDWTDTTIARVKRILAPEAIQFPGEKRFHPDGTPYLWFCDFDGSPRTQRVALMARAPSGEQFWTGNHFTPATPGDPCRGIILVSDPGWCFYWNPESVWSWKSPHMRWDQFAGCA